MKKTITLTLFLFLFGFSFLLQAQVANYKFNSYSGTYTAITGGTVLWSGTFDEQISSTITIPAFNFNGSNYTSIIISANGFITFGSTIPASNNYVPISNAATYSGAIAGFATDIHNSATGTPEVRYENTQTEFIVQWQDVKRYNLTGERISFQIRLNNVTNEIRIIYGGTITSAVGTTYPQIGLRGTSNVDFNNREVLVTGSWASSKTGTSNTKTCYFNGTTSTIIPASGLTFSFAPNITSANQSAYTFTNWGSQNEITALAEEGNYIWVGTTGGAFKRKKSDGQLVASYSFSDGLCSNNITNITIDNEGYKWFCTNGVGVSKFNSETNTWTTYDYSELQNSIINDMAIDIQGNKWFGSLNGAIKFDGTNWTYYNISNSSIANNFIYSILVDDIGNIWFGTLSGLSKLDYSGTWTTYTTSNGLPQNSINDLAKDNDGNIWIGTNGGLTKYNGSTFTTYTVANTSSGLTSNSVASIFIDVLGNKWVGNSDNSATKGLSKLSAAGVWSNYNSSNGLADPVVNEIITDDQGNVWLGTGNGLSRFNGTTFNTPIRSINSLASNSVKGVKIDSQGNKWFATKNGLSKYNSSTNVWTTYNIINGLLSTDLTCVTADGSGNIWIGTISNGISKLDPTTGVITNYHTGNSSIAANSITKIYFDSGNNALWIATSGSGLIRYNIAANTWLNYTISNSSIVSNTPTDMVSDGTYLWISTTPYWNGSANVGGGISRLTISSTTWTNYTSTSTSGALLSNYVQSVTIDTQGNKWFAVGNYFQRFDGTNWTSTFKPNTYDVRIDSYDNKWVGTQGYLDFGLLKSDNINLIAYSTAYGLAHYNVNDIAFDSDRSIWVGTEGGVSKLNCKTPQVDFTSSSACYPSSYTTFTNNSTNIDKTTSYLWDINNDGSYEYATKDIAHAFPSYGSFSVRLRVSNDGCYSESIETITVGSVPTVSLSPAGPSTICEGASLNITANITNQIGGYSYNYLWSTGATNSSINVASSGTYRVTVSNGACSGIPQSTTVNVKTPYNNTEICLVTVDSASGKNLIMWEKEPAATNVLSYNIYKVIGTSYALIDNVPFDAMSMYIDYSSNPDVTSSRYAIAAVDNCGNESDISSYHQTINLVTTVNPAGDAVGLIWNHYVDESSAFIPNFYYVYRGETADNLQFFAQVDGFTTSYNDNNPLNNKYYRISVQKSSGCYPSSSAKSTSGPFSQSISNVDENAMATALSITSVTAEPNIICAGESVQLTVNAAGGNGTLSYNWSSNPANFSSSIFNPIVSPTVTTTYNVTVSDGTNSATSSIIVNVNPLPVVALSSIANQCNNNEPLALTQGSPIGGIYSGSMVFNNKFYSEMAGSGIYPITYTYTDVNGCTNSTTTNITVNDAPVVNAGSDLFIESGNTANLNALSGGVGSYTYHWEPAALLVDPNVQNATSVVLNSSTVFTLTVINQTTTCQSSDEVTVFVSNSGAPLSISAITASPTTICKGESSQLTVLANGGEASYTYIWSDGNSFSSSVYNPTVQPVGNTTYHVTVSDGTNTATSSILITVNELPTVTLSGLQDLCNNVSSYYLTGGNPTGGNYSGDLVFNNKFYPSLAGEGSFNISYSYMNSNGCINLATSQINVSAAPEAIAGVDQLVNVGASATLNATNGGSGSLSYHWEPASLVINPDLQNATTINLTANTLFTLTVTNLSTDCSSTDQIMVFVNGGANALGILSINANNSTICLGESVQLNVLASGGQGNYTYQWSSSTNNLFSSSFANPTDSPTETTTYSVTVSDGITSITSSIEVVVGQIPNVTISDIDSVFVVDSAFPLTYGSPAGGSYSGIGVINNNFYPTLAGVGLHTISYQYFNTEGCSSAAETTIKVVTNVGIETIAKAEALTIYPNPFNNITNIVFNNPLKEIYTLYLIDVTGKIVKKINNIIDSQIIFSKENLTSGFYFVELRGAKVYRGKIIID